MHNLTKSELKSNFVFWINQSEIIGGCNIIGIISYGKYKLAILNALIHILFIIVFQAL